MTEASFVWLQQWYADHLDGAWEHQNGVRIETLDNPGWSLAIDIGSTVLRDRPFDQITIQRSEQDWLHARVREGRFEAHGGPRNLPEMIEVFRAWSEQAPRSEAA